MSEYPPSPVPSDARLWPDELPFTAFGQYGEDHLDLRVFDQGTWWVDVTGKPHLIADMNYAYRAGVVMFLRENTEYYHAGTALRAAVQLAGDLMLGNEPWEYLDAEAIMAQEPAAWLESTPLMKTLIDYLKLDES